MFKQIGDQCGGFINTEEETTLKNHLHWARGDGKKVLREIELTIDDYVYMIQIWVKSLITVRLEKGPVDNGRLDMVDKEPTDIRGGSGNIKKWCNFKFKAT